MTEVCATTEPMGVWVAPVLEGRIVRLEPLGIEHADGLWDASRDPRIWRWLSIVRPTTRQELGVWIEAARAAATARAELPLVTVCCKRQRIVGSTRYMALRPEHRSVEIGWTWLHPLAWGTGANVEAKLMMLRHAFETWDCRRVELKTDAANKRSRGAIEALGATFEGIHRHHMLVREGESRDSAWYSILDTEWPDVRRRLVERLET